MSSTNQNLTKALSKVRRDLISLFTLKGIKHPTDYDISSAASINFDIRFTKKESLTKKMVRILRAERTGKIAIKKESVSEIRFTILDDYIREFMGKDDTEKLPPSPTASKGAGRPQTEFGIFIEKLTIFIETKSGVKYKANPGFYLTKNESVAEKRIVIINCGDIYVTNKVLRELEMNEFYLSRIIEVDDKHIHVTQEAGVSSGIVIDSNLVSILGSIEKEAAAYKDSFVIHRESSIYFACTENPIEIAYTCQNDEESLLFVKAIGEYCKVKKDGKKVRLFFDEDTLKTLPLRKSFLSLPQKNLGTEATILQLVPSQDVYVYESRDYNEFKLLPFNRNTEKRHIMKLADSIEKHGVTSFVTIVVTDCIDGVMRKWVVDGQHRLAALEFLGRPILYTIVKANTKKEIVRLIADLNSSSRPWSVGNFMNAWSSLEIRDYTVLEELSKTTRLPFSFLVGTLSGFDRRKATVEFQKGDFEIVEEQNARKYINYILDLKSGLPRSHNIFEAFVFYFKRREAQKGYDHDLMKTRLSDYGGQMIFATGDSKETMIQKIDSIYLGELAVA